MNINFLEESAGVKSASRLVSFLLSLGALGLIVTMIIVALEGGEHAANIIMGLAGALTGTAGGAWGIMKSRTVPPEDA